MEASKREHLGQLIKSITEGNSQAISQIYEETGRVMFAVAGIYLQERSDVEEVVQDALMAIVRKANRFRENKNAYAWITKIVANTAKNKLISNKRRKALPLVNDVRAEPLFDDTSLVVHEAFQKLTVAERNVIIYTYWFGLSLSEAAEALHKSKSGVKYLLDKTLEKLKNIFDN